MLHNRLQSLDASVAKGSATPNWTIDRDIDVDEFYGSSMKSVITTGPPSATCVWIGIAQFWICRAPQRPMLRLADDTVKARNVILKWVER